MKKFTLLLLGFISFGTASLQAQNWVNGGNSLSANGSIGTKTNYSLIFKTYNSERGRITNTGLWGIGTTIPNAKLHINSTISQEPFRVQVNKTTKLLVNRNGGVSIGFGSTPPTNGLLVNGHAAIGATTSSSSTQLNVVLDTDFGWGISGSGSFTGVRGDGDTFGVFGSSDYGIGVEGYSEFDGYGGRFYSEAGTALIASTYYGEYVGIFEGDISAAGYYSSSDKNIKKNIQEVGNAISIINKLKPSYYQFRDDGKYAALHLPKGNHYGLLAQDVEEVLPNLVKESTHEIKDHKSIAAIKPSADGKSVLDSIKNEPNEKINIKAVNYTELIPIVIKGMQEQQQTIEEQKQLIQQLQQENNAFKERLTKLEAVLGSGGKSFTGGYNGANLEQNYPNPFKGTTIFNYSIPKNAKAQILVYDVSGKLVRTLAASDSGQVQMDAYGLSAGTYTYTLIVDGNIVTSKHMLLKK